MKNKIEIKFNKISSGKQEEQMSFSFETDAYEFEILRHGNDKKSISRENGTIYLPSICTQFISRTKPGKLSFDTGNNTWSFSNSEGKESKIENGGPFTHFYRNNEWILLCVNFSPLEKK